MTDQPVADVRVVPPSALRTLGVAILEAIGTPSAIAAAVTDHMVDANLVGYDSHGIHLLPVYIEDVRNGELRPAAEPVVEWQRDVAALVSGEWGFGQYTSRFAMDLGIRLARRSGIAIVGMVRLHHTGRVGAYVEQAARAGCAALAFVAGTGGAVQAAPWGGSRRAYGANPFGAGFPATDRDHLVVDFATTTIAGGKVMIARATGSPLPEGVLLDNEGRPTTNSEDLFQGGALLPFGEHKGYGLALTGEMLARVLTGSDALGEPTGGGDRFGRSGSTFMVIDADLFRTGAAAEAARTFAAIRAIPPIPGGPPVRTPGEREARSRRERTESGISLPTVTVQALLDTARSVGVAPEVIAELKA